MNREELIVAEARRWIGTPYVHQASCLGAGSDCLGLVRGIYRNVVGPEPFSSPAYTMDWNECSGEDVLFEAAQRFLVRRMSQCWVPGDVLLFRMRDGAVAKHLGIRADDQAAPSFIHAYSGHGVVESPLSAPWVRRVVATFAFPRGD